MSALANLARVHTTLNAAETDHLHRLVATWGLLADLSFADLLLLAPMASQGSYPEHYVVLAQVRPTTSPTLNPNDLIGLCASAQERPSTNRAFRSGEVVDRGGFRESLGEEVRALAIPIRFGGRVIAVLLREYSPAISRRLGELEQTYLTVFDRFVKMLMLGEYPFPAAPAAVPHIPRVGDGALLLDEVGRVRYSSPNANSALHRMGVVADVGDRLLGDVGLDGGVVHTAMATRLPAIAELSPSSQTHVLAHCIPLLERGTVVGALLLVRDVSDLKRLDRLLVTKDAHIREIHHRVKNNLQTISSLLRIQARRLSSPEAKQAIQESVRRIASIAVVHETLSREASEDVTFVELARPLIRMVEESLLLPDRRVRFSLVGEGSTIPAATATPLALVITELLQNAVDHGFPVGSDYQAANVLVEITSEPGSFTVSVSDDGAGLQPEFSLATSDGLGLSIVQTLVESELGGSIVLKPLTTGGTLVQVRVPTDSGTN